MGTASPRKIAANRRNAARSTGPRTGKGKARSKLNSLQHGLAAKPPRTVAIDRDLERLASEIAGPSPDPERRHFALVAAEAELKLRQVRAVRLRLLSELSEGPAASPSSQEETKRAGGPIRPTNTWVTLLRLDRYERRALSRRDRALRLL